MKIKEINIDGFGKLHDVHFKIQDQFQGFYGLNEAGKTTIRQFIYSILFGFATARGKKKAYLQYLPKAKGYGYGGNLVVDYQNQSFKIDRVKGKNGGTVTITNLTTKTEESPDLLSEMLGPVDQELYTAMIGFSEDDLLATDALSRDELRRKLLKMGAVGSDAWLKLEKDLLKTADGLYRPRGKNQTLNQKLVELDEKQQELVQVKQKMPTYAEIHKQETQLNDDLEKVRLNRTNDDERVQSLRTLAQNWDALDEITTLSKDIENAKPEYLAIDVTRLKVLANQLSEERSKKIELTQQLNEQTVKNDAPDLDTIKNLAVIADQIPQIKLQMGQQRDYVNRLNRLQGEQKDIYAQYPELDFNQLEPFSDEEVTQLNQLQTVKKRTTTEINQIQNQILSRPHQTNQTQASLITFIVAGIVTLGTLFSGFAIGLKILIIVVSWLLSGWLYNKSGNTTNNDPTLEDELEKQEQQLDEINHELDKLGSEHNFARTEQSNWITVQNLLIRMININREIDETFNQNNQIEAELNQFWRTVQSNPELDQITEFDSAGLDKISEYYQQMQSKQTSIQMEHQKVKFSEQDLARTNQQIDVLQNQIKHILGSIPDIDTIKELSETIKLLQEKNSRLNLLKESTSNVDFNLKKQFKNFDELEQKINSLEEQLAQANKVESSLLDKKADLMGTSNGIKSQNSLEELQQSIEYLKTDILEITDEWLTNQLSAQWIEETLTVATHGRLPQMLGKAAEYMAIITDNRYSKIEFKDDDIRLYNPAGYYLSVLELSRGTAEQLYIAIRLAFMDSITNQINLPIIIDDGFVNFDLQRMNNIYQILTEISTNHQVLYFTSRPIETQLISVNNIINLM